MRKIALGITVALTLSWAGSIAASEPDEKCQAAKNQDAGKLAACLQKAEAKLVKTAGACSAPAGTECYRDTDCTGTCVKDTAKYDAAIDKCKEKYRANWAKAEEKNASQCPDVIADPNSMVSFIAAHCNVVASVLAGDGLPANVDTCNDNLEICAAGTATAANVSSGKTFSSNAGLGLTGTMPNNGNLSFTPSLTAQTIPAGYYDGTGQVLPVRQLEVVFAESGLANRDCRPQGFVSTCSDVDVTGSSRDSMRVAVGDLNGDGKLDAVFANLGQPNRVCLGDGTGGFSCSNVNGDTNDGMGVALGDVNGDGNLDAVFANSTSSPNGGRNRVCFGNGSGAFSGCSDTSTDTDDSYGVALGDLNADSHLDAVFANYGEASRVCLGNGTGGFSCSNVSADANMSNAVALGDVNGDNRLDAVFANDTYSPNGGRNRVCFGNGSGGFSSCSDVGSDQQYTVDVALGDVNGDGHLDAVFANFRADANRVCLGNGSGGFSCSNAGNDADDTTGVVLADVNGDGDLDAVFANWDQPNRVCFGDGSGAFSCSALGADANSTNGLALGYLN